MDLQALSGMNEMLTNHLEMMKKKQQAQMNSTAKCNANNQNKSGIVLARKGDSGYVQCFDTDNDGEITMEEFNNYCEEKGISEKEKLKLISLMGTAKTNSKIVEKTSESPKEEKESEKIENEGAIYARKGDDKYNEVMDTDKNSIVTYKEYMEYCNKKSEKTENSEKSNTSESKAAQKYYQNEHSDEEPEMSVEAVA